MAIAATAWMVERGGQGGHMGFSRFKSMFMLDQV
jgi:hypothetical protein